MKNEWLYSGILALALIATAARADDYVLTLKNNQFSPKEITIPADQKVKLTVKNLDASAAEFESYDLNREKVVSGNEQISVFVGPLKPGKYAFFDDFHKDTTTGTLIAK